jgi:RNA polymerase sigma factor (sigma-70 family)
MTVTPEAIAAGERLPDRFVTTRWSVILSCADSQASAQASRDALTHLCQTYWRPIFAFVCHRGYSIPDAQDLTQDFFVMLLEGHLLERADPNRGRFRSLLLKALKDFLSDAQDKRRARKRGGDVQFVRWDEWMAEYPSQFSVSAHDSQTWPPEKIFDVRWAATVVERALLRLAEECERRGRRRVFDVLRNCLGAEREDVSYSTFAKTLGVPESSVKRLVHQLRKRYRQMLREEIADTVESPALLEEELRYLCAALSTAQ